MVKVAGRAERQIYYSLIQRKFWLGDILRKSMKKRVNMKKHEKETMIAQKCLP